MGDSSEVPALRRGLAVLSLLATRPGPVTAAAIAREAGLPRSTTYHLLSELEAAGFVVHLPAERRYGLGIADIAPDNLGFALNKVGLLLRPLRL